MAKTVKMSATGLELSPMGFGCMGITAFYGPPMEDSAALALLQRALDLGYTHFDTAEVYTGKRDHGSDKVEYNEVILGEFLRSKPRESYTVATKFFPPLSDTLSVEPEEVKARFAASLERLGLDYVDIYYLHRMPPTVEELEGWMAVAKSLVETAKVRYIGLSEVSASWLRRAHAVHPVSCVQMEWSLASRSLEDSVVPVCKELGIGIVAYSPLSRNLLCPPAQPPDDFRGQTCPRYQPENFDKNKEVAAQVAALAEGKGATAAQVSLAWLYYRAKIMGVQMVPIPGTTKAERAEENIAALGIALSEAEAGELERLGALVVGPRYNEKFMAYSFELQL